MANFEVELESGFKWDIIGLAETKLKGCFKEKLSHGHLLFNSGVPESARKFAGVGFVINKKHEENILQFKSISERLCYLKIKGKFNNQVFIQCYAPTSSYSDEVVESFYNSLQDLVDLTANRDDLFIIGDFNAKVGGTHHLYPEVVGRHNNHARGHNDRGLRLIDFCTRNSMVITNTFFEHRRKHTWVSPDGTIKNTIDFILTKKKSLKNVTDAHTAACIDISDHHIVRCTFRASTFKAPKKQFQPKYNVAALNDEETRTKYQTQIEERLAIISTQEFALPSDINKAISETIKDCALSCLPKTKKEKKQWITNETIEAIKLKDEIRSKLGSDALSYKLHKSNVKKMCLSDIKTSIEKDHMELKHLSPQEKYFNAMKKLKSARTRKQSTWGIKASDGTPLTEKVDILERWASFYQDLYSDNQSSPLFETTESIPEILLDEVQSALKTCKNGKATGPDGINAELLKFGGVYLEKLLLKLFILIVKTSTFPDEFKQAEIVTLYKKGDSAECGNYRPICLLNHVYKILMQIIYKRISATLRESLPSNQAAYQPGRNTVEQIQALQQVIEKSKEYNVDGFICFVDYTKAFDSLHQSKLWNALRNNTNISPAYINFLIKAYESSSATIRTSLGNTRWIDILKGVKQGDVLSALLFCIAIGLITDNAFDETDGIAIGGINWSDLGYADDLGVLAKCLDELKKMMKKLSEESAKMGLKINYSKTKIMPIGPLAKTFTDKYIKINNKEIEVINRFEYLGRILDNQADDTAAVQHRIAKGWQIFQKKKSILTHRKLPMKSKKMTYETYILPSVLYSAETITWTPALLKKLRTFQNHVMRWMTNHKLSDRVSIARLTSLTQLDDIISELKTRKLTWFGHLKRSSLPARTITEGIIPGTRKRGRPSRRWLQDVIDWTQMSVAELCVTTNNREEWRRISHRPF